MRTHVARGLGGVVALALVAGVVGCGGDGDADGGGDPTASIESCLDGAGLSVISSSDVNELDAKLVAAGAESQIQATSTEDQTSYAEFITFGTEDDAAAYGDRQKDELGYTTETHGTVVLTTFADDAYRADYTDCAEAAG